jgi:membrane-associated phospholipid phosphatase
MPTSRHATAGLTLPVLPSAGWKYAAGAVVALCAAVLYLVPNRMVVEHAVALPLTSAERMLPFWPWTGWIYNAIYVFVLASFAGMRDLAVASRFLYACLFTQVIAAAVFVAFPTVYPRDLFPLPAGVGASEAALVELVRGIDRPVNCFPSLHVSTCVLCLAAYAHEPLRRYRHVALAVALLLVASTLTFKQHYAVDLAGGAALGLAGYGIFFRWSRIRLAEHR